MMVHIPTTSANQVERNKRRADPAVADLWDLLDQVKDPEIPVLSLWDLGALRNIEWAGDKVVITITPTYSGCPAMNTMEEDIETVMRESGYTNVEIRTQLAPAWTTDWLSPEGRRKLQEYGIAPPQEAATDKRSLLGTEPEIPCPKCHSTNTRKISEFGSTACKALYLCNDCHEPFDYFKCL